MRHFLNLRISFNICLAFVFVCSSIFAQKHVIGYYPDWIKFSMPPSSVPVAHLTQINHAFIWPQSNGNLSTYNNFVQPALNNAMHAAGKKILVSVGGAGNSDGFAPMVADSAALDNFVNNIVNFLQTHQYDGIDLDWEFPQNNTQKQQLNQLVIALRTAFDQVNPDWMITMAVNPGHWFGQWIDYPTLKNYVDIFGAMTYDFHGGWTSHAGHNSPLYQPTNDFDGSVETGYQYVHQTRGVPKDQMVIGIPFYGREFNAMTLYGASTGGNTAYVYNDIRTFLNNGWTYHWDNFSKVPYAINPGNSKLITFDDSASVAEKAHFALSKDVSGVMIWALGQDWQNGQAPLLASAANVIMNATGIEDKPIALPQTLLLHGNYPNPFNPSTTIHFELPKSADVELAIFDIKGKLVKTLVKAILPAGEHRIHFNANRLASGVYLYRLSAGTIVRAGKMILLR